MLIQMQIGQVIRLIDALSYVSVSYWVLLLSRGVARSKMWFPVLVPRLSIVPLLTPPASLSIFAGSWLTWMLHSQLPLLFIATTSAIYFAHNDVFHEHTKHIEIDCHITCQHLKKGISSCSPSPLLTSLLISSPRLTRLVVFEILYPNSTLYC